MVDTTYKSVGQLQDWANLVLAVVLFASPWALGFAADATPAWNAWLCGIAIAALAAAALWHAAAWEEWLNAILGIWVAVSPWVLGFAAATAAMWTHLVIGLLVAALAAWQAWSSHPGGTHATA